MLNKSKSVLLISGGILGLIIIIVLVRILFNQPANIEFPELSDISNLAPPVQEQISEAVRKTRRNPSAENLGMLGMVYHSSANYPEALKCYKLAIEKSKSEWIWNYYYGYLNMEMGESATAIENFTRVTEKNPQIHLAWYYLGEEYKNIRNNELAEKSFGNIISVKSRTTSSTSTRQDHFPLGNYATFELARIYFDSGRSDLAEETLKELIGSSNLFGAPYKLLGNIYNLRGDSIPGNQFTVRANDLINFSPPVDTLIDRISLMSRSELYLLKKIDEAEKSMHSDWALKLVTQGLQFMPDNDYLVSKAIKIYLWKNLNDQAIALTDKHIQLFANNLSEIKGIGIIFFQKGLFEQAAKYWTKSLELKPNETIIEEYLAKCLWATGNKQKAIEILDQIIEKNPGNAEVIADVTDLMFQLGEKEKGIKLLEMINKMDPSNPKAQRILGGITLKNKEIKKAIELYENSFKGNPEDVKTIQELGDIFLYHKMWDKYTKLYKTALKYHPNNPSFLSRTGEVLISCPDTSFRNIEEGIIYSERAFTHYNCPPEIIVATGSHLAYAYAMLGDKQKAITTISQTINIGRREKISETQQAKLEALLNALQNLDSQ